MTEKRFKYTFEGIEDTLEPYEEYKYTLCNKDGFQDLCDMLNELHEENEQLKQAISDWKGSYYELYQDIKILRKENEQLYELINFANTLIAFKTSESCQMEWEKRLKELKSE